MADSGSRPPRHHESPLHWLEDVASMFAGKRVGIEAAIFLFGLVGAVLIGIFFAAFHR